MKANTQILYAAVLGTMHIKFKDLNEWYLLNKAYGELKGFTLSEQYK